MANPIKSENDNSSVSDNVCSFFRPTVSVNLFDVEQDLAKALLSQQTAKHSPLHPTTPKPASARPANKTNTIHGLFAARQSSPSTGIKPTTTARANNADNVLPLPTPSRAPKV